MRDMKNENSVVFQQTENSIIVRKSGLEIRQWSMALRNPKMGRITWLNNHKNCAPSEDRTHDLQIALIQRIMRLTRYLLRYRGSYKTTSQNDYYDHLSAMKLRAQSTPQLARKCKVKNTLGRKIQLSMHIKYSYNDKPAQKKTGGPRAIHRLTTELETTLNLR